VRNRLLLLVLATSFALAAGLGLRAQQPAGGDSSSQNDLERKRQFLKAREEMRTVTATPTPGSTSAPRPKPKAHATPETNSGGAATVPVPAPAASRPTPEPERPPVTPRGRERRPPVTPLAVTPAPAPVTIEKSGYEKEEGLQPAPSSGWFQRWKYLTKSVQYELTRAPVQRRRWRYIVVHNSGTRQGNAKAFDYYHLHVRHMVNGLAYHFVIGNGTSTGDGEIEIGNRWKRQINGGHVHSDYLNNIALGICLVGDFNRDTPSQRQLGALDELIRFLRERVGKIDRQWAIVKAHRDINPPRWPTDCPGDKFPYSWLRRYD
jgi:hypothetical protein